MRLENSLAIVIGKPRGRSLSPGKTTTEQRSKRHKENLSSGTFKNT
jgi:hypothetical protein